MSTFAIIMLAFAIIMLAFAIIMLAFAVRGAGVRIARAIQAAHGITKGNP